MSSNRRRQEGKPALDLVEEAAQLMRTAPAATWLAYYLGTTPFVLGLLYFAAELGSSPFARPHLIESSLGMSWLFLWMKCWQVVFSRRIRAQVTRHAMPTWTLGRCWRIFSTQATVQPTALFLFPLLILPVPPFPWARAFYENLTALCDGEPASLRSLVKRSWDQASLWPRQGAIISALIACFGAVVLLNWMSVCGLIPHLIKMLLGIDSSFARSGVGLLNSTFFSVVLGFTYLCVDPLVKILHALRCFYGESIQSGEDLKADLKHYSSASHWVAGILMALVLWTAPGALGAEPERPTAPVTVSPTMPNGIAPSQLDEALGRTIHTRKYAWRMPREAAPAAEANRGPIGEFFIRIGDAIDKAARAASHWIRDWLDRMFRRQQPPDFKAKGFGDAVGALLTFLVYVLVAVVVGLLAWWIWKLYRNREEDFVPASAAVAQPTVNLADESVGADRLPEDGWIKLGNELLEQGELRLAMRAFYFASLAHLASRNLIGLARFKSNRDYESELRRRSHSLPTVLPVFHDNLSLFECIWYGTHPVDRPTVLQFAQQVQRIKAVS